MKKTDVLYSRFREKNPKAERFFIDFARYSLWSYALNIVGGIG